MKTRRKNVKTPAKGRRSSIICVRKSPIARRNPRRNVRNTSKSIKFPTYESPLVHLYNNGPPDQPQTSIESKQVKNNNIDEEETKCNIINLPSSSKDSINIKAEIHDIKEENKCEIDGIEQIQENKCVIDDTEQPEENTDMERIETRTLLKSKKRSLISRIGAGEIIKPKKRKVKKSPLSKINEKSDINNLSDSVILIDDSEFHPSIETSLNNPTQDITLNEPMRNISLNNSTKSTSVNEPFMNSLRDEYEKKSILRETDTNNEDIVIIDCPNEDSFMEMDAYHEAFKSGDSSCDSRFMDSVIIIDHDDDPPPVRTDFVPKPAIAPKPFIARRPTATLKPTSIPRPTVTPRSIVTPRPTAAFKPIITPRPIAALKPTVASRPTVAIKPTTELKPTVAPKLSEDCFVVWSSLPKPCTSNNTANTDQFTLNNTSNTQQCTSNNEPHSSHQQPWINNNTEILKCDKILLDTTPDKNNLKYLNNENDKPKKKISKSPKVNPKKTLTKVAAKTRVTKATTKASMKAATKVATKTTATTTLKKRVKNNGQLIFTSETKDDESEDTTKKKPKHKKGTPREIVIDGSNVAMAYTHNKMFSEKGIKMLIDYFTKKGHTVKVFIPQYRRSRNFPLLEKWHNDGIVVFTPSRKLGTKFITSYDDRYILEYATTCDGIVVSQDQFRDLYAEKPQYRDTIENRLLVPTFVGDYVMFPEDPLGRDGPTLKDFLKH